MTAADQTHLTPAPSRPSEDGPADDRMNAFEKVVNFALDGLPAAFFVALMAVTVTAGAVELFLELGPYWSIAVTAGLIASGLYGGSRLRRIPLVLPTVRRRGADE